jgi:hypothetical protein
MPVCSTFGVRLAADLPCGTSAAAGEKPAVGCAGADNRNSDLQDVSTGATGLEPATSGVTGLFHRYDDWRRLTRYRSIHAGLRALRADLCTMRRLDFGRFLPFCCPDAAWSSRRRYPPSVMLDGLSWAHLADGSGRGRRPLSVVAAAARARSRMRARPRPAAQRCIFRSELA